MIHIFSLTILIPLRVEHWRRSFAEADLVARIHGVGCRRGGGGRRKAARTQYFAPSGAQTRRSRRRTHLSRIQHQSNLRQNRGQD